jgi:hypothetical protein
VNRSYGGSGPVAARRELGIYLNDHLAGATAGTELARRLAASAPEPEVREALRGLAEEIAQDRAALVQITRSLGFRGRRYKACAGWIAERVGRLKTNGHLVRRSPLSTLLELEMLRLGAEGKAACWRTLRDLADHMEGVDSAGLKRLLSGAARQIEVLEKLHAQAAGNLRSKAPTYDGQPWVPRTA